MKNQYLYLLLYKKLETKKREAEFVFIQRKIEKLNVVGMMDYIDSLDRKMARTRAKMWWVTKLCL